MTKSNKEYDESINRVISYIHSNLDRNMTIEELASVSNFSAYHFHRLLKAFLGESLWQYVKRIRLETGAKLLLYSNDDISEISYRVGYDTPSSFSSSFKKEFGVSPTQFKIKKGNVKMKKTPIEKKEIQFDLSPRISVIEDQNYIYRRLYGAFSEQKFETAWTDFIQYAIEKQLLKPGANPFTVYLDDPKITEESKLKYDICLPVESYQASGETGNSKIESNKYAIFLYKGSYNNLEQVYDEIFQKWLPNSNEELGTHKLFEKYLNSPTNTLEDELLTEIYIPIK